MRIAHLLLFTLGLVASAVNATTPGIVSLDKLYEISDQVLQVHVISGRENSIDKRDCGVRYTGHVEASWKGMAKGSKVEFTTGPGLPANIGETYVVYLATWQNPKVSPMASTNSRDMQRQAQWLQRCEGILAPYLLAHYRSIYRVWQMGHTEKDISVLFEVNNPYTPLPTQFMTERRGNNWRVLLDTFDSYLRSNAVRQ